MTSRLTSRRAAALTSTKASDRDLQAGDQVLVHSRQSEPVSETWGFLISVDNAEPGDLWVVFDTMVSTGKGGESRVNQVVKIHRDQIMQVVQKDKKNPLLHLRLSPEDNSILVMRRIDGKTGPLVVQIDQGRESTTYRVDHQGSREI